MAADFLIAASSRGRFADPPICRDGL